MANHKTSSVVPERTVRSDAGVVQGKTGTDLCDACHHFLHGGGAICGTPGEATDDEFLQLSRDLLARQPPTGGVDSR